MTWQELLDQIEYRSQQGDGASSAASGDEQAPYYKRARIEKYLKEVSTQLLLEIPQAEAEAIGGDAILEMSVSSGDALPLEVISCLAARMDNEPATEVSPAHFFQLDLPMDPLYGVKAYSFFSGNVYHSGTSLDLVLLIEPTLATYRADGVTLPAQYDEVRIERVHQLLLAMDFLETGGV